MFSEKSKEFVVVKCKLCKDVFFIKFIKNHECEKKENENNKKNKKRQKKIDLENHCGVVMFNGKLCTNSLNCKVHNVEEKRKVKGRLYNYDQLLKIVSEERKKRRKEENTVNNQNIQKEEDLEVDKQLKNYIINLNPIVEKTVSWPLFDNETGLIKQIFMKKNNSIIDKNTDKRGI